MDIELDEGDVTNRTEAVDLAGLDDKNVTCAGLEFLSVHGPHAAALSHELDFIVRMAMRSGTTPREGAEEKYGDIHVAIIGPYEMVRAALEWQVLLTHAVHFCAPSGGVMRGSGKRAAPVTREAAAPLLGKRDRAAHTVRNPAATLAAS
jgi:hypothetical protein